MNIFYGRIYPAQTPCSPHPVGINPTNGPGQKCPNPLVEETGAWVGGTPTHYGHARAGCRRAMRVATTMTTSVTPHAMSWIPMGRSE